MESYIIQNAVYIQEMKTFFMAPINPEESQTIVLDDGLALTIGGGLQSAWRSPQEVLERLSFTDRYEEFTLVSDQTIEWIRERLLWRDSGFGATGILIKDMDYTVIFHILASDNDPDTTLLTTIEREVLQYWLLQKEEKPTLSS